MGESRKKINKRQRERGQDMREATAVQERVPQPRHVQMSSAHLVHEHPRWSQSRERLSHQFRCFQIVVSSITAKAITPNIIIEKSPTRPANCIRGFFIILVQS